MFTQISTPAPNPMIDHAVNPPFPAAVGSVTSEGQWTRHLNGAAETLPGRPGPHDFSAIAGELAGTPPPAPAADDMTVLPAGDDRLAGASGIG